MSYQKGKIIVTQPQTQASRLETSSEINTTPILENQ
jgi:hypothetical protein